MARSAFIGAARLRRKLKRIDPDLRTEIADVIAQTSADLAADIKANTPVSKGSGPHLRDAIRSRVAKDRLSGRAGLLTPTLRRRFYYWRFLELGTRKMPARPFVGPAVLRAEKSYPAAIRAAVDKALANVVSSG